MLSPSDFNNAVPQFTNGTYASNPINPQYVNEPTSTEYNQGVEPLQTLPAQWWNWFINKFTGRFNKINTYVKNIFNELTQLLSLANITPDGTESTPTTCQLKDMFACCYPDYVKCCTTGTACGCVPVIGSELCCGANHFVVTDANGNLKPTSITVGTAAGCDASCFLSSDCMVACACYACFAGHSSYATTLGANCCNPPSTSCVYPFATVSCCYEAIENKCYVYLCGTMCYRDEGEWDNYACMTKVWKAHKIDTVSACDSLCYICKGRTGYCFCYWICAKRDVILFQRPLQSPLGGHAGSAGLCGPFFIHKNDYLYWCCSASAGSDISGCFGKMWWICTPGSTSNPGEETARCCFTSKAGNGAFTADGTGIYNRGNWLIIPANIDCVGNQD